MRCDNEHIHFCQSLKRIPVLQYLKKPVETLNELYSRYPDGGEYGWFAFVNENGTFAYWDNEALKWKLLSEGGALPDINISDINGLTQILNTLKESDIEIINMFNSIGEITAYSINGEILVDAKTDSTIGSSTMGIVSFCLDRIYPEFGSAEPDDYVYYRYYLNGESKKIQLFNTSGINGEPTRLKHIQRKQVLALIRSDIQQGIIISSTSINGPESVSSEEVISLTELNPYYLVSDSTAKDVLITNSYHSSQVTLPTNIGADKSIQFTVRDGSDPIKFTILIGNDTEDLIIQENEVLFAFFDKANSAWNTVVTDKADTVVNIDTQGVLTADLCMYNAQYYDGLPQARHINIQGDILTRMARTNAVDGVELNGQVVFVFNPGDGHYIEVAGIYKHIKSEETGYYYTQYFQKHLDIDNINTVFVRDGKYYSGEYNKILRKDDTEGDLFLRRKNHTVKYADPNDGLTGLSDNKGTLIIDTYNTNILIDDRNPANIPTADFTLDLIFNYYMYIVDDSNSIDFKVKNITKHYCTLNPSTAFDGYSYIHVYPEKIILAPEEEVEFSAYISRLNKNLFIRNLTKESKIVVVGSHEEINALADAGLLIPGGSYIISDYQMFSPQISPQISRARSFNANDTYELFLTAVSENAFDENIDALTPYSTATFRAKYNIEKDEAIPEHKGTILELADDKGNILPYDFYNKKIWNEELQGYFWTFSTITEDEIRDETGAIIGYERVISRNDNVSDFVVSHDVEFENNIFLGGNYRNVKINSKVFSGNLIYSGWNQVELNVTKFEDMLLKQDVNIENLLISGFSLFGIDLKLPEGLIALNPFHKELISDILKCWLEYWDRETLIRQVVEVDLKQGGGSYSYGYSYGSNSLVLIGDLNNG